MKIDLSSEELQLAIEEYVRRRGISSDKIIKTVVIGGRNGNFGTAAIYISNDVLAELSEPPKTFLAVNNLLDSRKVTPEEEFLVEPEIASEDIAKDITEEVDEEVDESEPEQSVEELTVGWNAFVNTIPAEEPETESTGLFKEEPVEPAKTTFKLFT